MYDHTVVSRFWAKVNIKSPDECWEWQAFRNQDGYGTIAINGRSNMAHRVSFEMVYGPIPSGMLVCHSCDNPACVNPQHLWLGTSKDNMKDRIVKGRIGKFKIPYIHPKKTPIHRFEKWVNKTDECWIWTGYLDNSGRGRFYYKGKSMRAHRAAYLLYNGNIPSNICVCHSCDNPICVNPDHLWLGTQNDNVQDMINKGRDRKAYGDKSASRLYPERLKRGEDVWLSKLNTQSVIAIRQEYSMGTTSHSILAKKYGVSKPTIRNVVTRRTWKHIP